MPISHKPRGYEGRRRARQNWIDAGRPAVQQPGRYFRQTMAALSQFAEVSAYDKKNSGFLAAASRGVRKFVNFFRRTP